MSCGDAHELFSTGIIPILGRREGKRDMTYRGSTAVLGVAARTKPWSLDERILIHMALKLELVPDIEGIIDPGLDLVSDESDPNVVNVRTYRANIRTVRSMEHQAHVKRNGPMSHNSYMVERRLALRMGFDQSGECLYFAPLDPQETMHVVGSLNIATPLRYCFKQASMNGYVAANNRTLGLVNGLVSPTAIPVRLSGCSVGSEASFGVDDLSRLRADVDTLKAAASARVACDAAESARAINADVLLDARADIDTFRAESSARVACVAEGSARAVNAVISFDAAESSKDKQYISEPQPPHSACRVATEENDGRVSLSSIPTDPLLMSARCVQQYGSSVRTNKRGDLHQKTVAATSVKLYKDGKGSHNNRADPGHYGYPPDAKGVTGPSVRPYADGKGARKHKVEMYLKSENEKALPSQLKDDEVALDEINESIFQLNEGIRFHKLQSDLLELEETKWLN